MDIPRLNVSASLALLQGQGFSARTFIDIGAAEGVFFLQRTKLGLFPEARHFFVDAMEENTPYYKKIAHLTSAGYAITALSCVEGSVNVSVDPGFYNTHVAGLQKTDYPITRSVPATTLDNLVKARSLLPPYILKLDVQGSELDILRGARHTLSQSTIVVAESQICFERDTLADLLAYMQSHGFVLFDLTNLGYYSSGLLYECYATFIPAARDFRNKLKSVDPGDAAASEQYLRDRRQQIIEAIDRLGIIDPSPTHPVQRESASGAVPHPVVH